MDHIIVLRLAEEFVIALHHPVETHAHEVHIRRVLHVPERVLVLRPHHAPLYHGRGVVAHGCERGECGGAEGGVRVAVRMWDWGAGAGVGGVVGG